MKLVTTIECQPRAVASLEEDGTLAVKVFASAEYAPGMTTTAEYHDVSSEKKEALKAALQAVLDEASEKLGPKIAQAVYKSTEISAAHGEI